MADDERTSENTANGPSVSGLAFARKDGQDESEPATEAEVEKTEEEAAQQTQISKAKDAAAELLRAAEAPEVGDDADSVIYTSHPIARFKFGRFQFEKGQLIVRGKDREVFEKLLDNASPRTKARVKKIDADAGARIAARFNETTRRRGVDTSRPGPSGGKA